MNAIIDNLPVILGSVIASSIIVLTLLTFILDYLDNKETARMRMKEYGRRFRYPLECGTACIDYYAAIRLHDHYGIMFPEIGYEDADEFRRAAIASFARYMQSAKACVSTSELLKLELEMAYLREPHPFYKPPIFHRIRLPKWHFRSN